MKKFSLFVENLIGTLTAYTRTERSGAVSIVVIVTSLLCAVALIPQKLPEPEYLAEMDRRADSLRRDYFLRLNAERRSEYLFERSDGRSVRRSENPGSRMNVPPAKKPVHIELNTADSARLCTVRGVGPAISRNIVEYRSRLGGFVRKEQLKEIRGITDENFGEISAQFFIDTTAVQKININFATLNQLGVHPYFTRSMAQRIVRARESKGGWNKLRELIDNDILLPDEARKVAPYVVFEAR